MYDTLSTKGENANKISEVIEVTVVAKRVKSLYLHHPQLDLVAGDPHIGGIADSHMWQEDVTVIGVSLINRISPLTDLDSGYIYNYAEVSRNGVGPGQVGAFLRVDSYLGGHSVTVGIGSSEVATQPYGTKQMETMMYPSGYGVDMDENTQIFLHFGGRNTMANNHGISSAALIYYVER